MNSILDQQDEKLKEEYNLDYATVCGYIRNWKDTDGKLHYELTEKGVKRLAALMVE